MKLHSGLCPLVLILAASMKLADAITFNISTIDVPGSTTTIAIGINNAGQIVGSYVSGSQTHGFLYANGTFTTLDVPGSSSTEATGINNVGQIVGFYTDATGSHVFLDTNGVFSTLNIPASNSLPPIDGPKNQVAINDVGQVVGTTSGPRGFLYSNGQVTFLPTISIVQPFNSANGINNAGAIAGSLAQQAIGWGAFVYLDGNYIFNSGDEEAARGINNAGDIVVNCGDCSQFGNATFLFKNGATSFLPPIPPSSFFNGYGRGLNDFDQIVGSYFGFSGGVHGFLATPVSIPPTALQFVPVTPCRIADTRGNGFAGQYGPPELAANSARTFRIGGQCGIPTNALAYSLNATVVPDAPLGYMTVWPGAQSQPFVSTLNSFDGRIKANAAIVPAGVGATISVYATDPTNFILDTDGYFTTSGTNALTFYPLTPCRIADTRDGQGFSGAFGPPSIDGGTSRSFPINPIGGVSNSCTNTIPTTAQAYSLNMTAIPKTGSLIYITTWPTGQTQPTVSTLNAPTGTIVANAALVPANGTQGAVSVFASDSTDLLIDIDGYFAPPGNGGLSLYTLPPCRVIDTRNNGSPFSGTLPVSVAGSCGAPGNAQAYVFNATVVPPNQLAYLTLWPDGQAQPFVSTLNAFDGAVTSNMAIVPSSNGSIDAFASNPTHLILDIFSYFAP